MPLSDASVRNAKTRESDYKLSDGGGLYLLVKANGSRLWNMAYRFGGKQKKLSIGVYPVVGLADARNARLAAKKSLNGGEDPSLKKRLAKLAGANAADNTFRKLGDEFVARRKAEEAAPRTIKKYKQNLKHAYRRLGDRPITAITAADIFEVLKGIEKAGHLETAREVRSLVDRVFRLAIVTARATDNPAVSLVGATRAPPDSHYAAIFEPQAVGALMRAIRGYEGGDVTRLAMTIMALTFARSEELRGAKPGELDLEGDEPMWTIPTERTKMKRGPHFVPLARGTVAAFRELLELNASPSILFPGIRSVHRPISDGTINAALRRMGYSSEEMTGHGFRRTASTLLNEQGWDEDWIERQLSHKDPNKVRGAYNAAEYLPGRRRMMQAWADYLDRLAADEDDLIG